MSIPGAVSAHKEHTTDNLLSMWGALYCYTPEVIPSVHRGTGTGIAAAFNRICGLMAPIIATYVGFTDVPIYVSASLYMAAGFLSFILPFESMGKASI
jgi:hypothetical protein